jgi:hypothetical protein
VRKIYEMRLITAEMGFMRRTEGYTIQTVKEMKKS